MTAYHRCLTILGALILGAWLLAIVLTPFLVAHGPNERFVPFALPGFVTPEGVSFPFGTDHVGRDILARTVSAAGNILGMIGLMVLIIYLLGLRIAIWATGNPGLRRRLAAGLVAFGGSVPWVITFVVFIAAVGLNTIFLLLAFFLASLPGLRDEVLLLHRAFGPPETEQPTKRQATAFLFVALLKRMALFIAIAECIAATGLGPMPPPAATLGGVFWANGMMALAFPHMVAYPIAALISLLLGLNMLASGIEGLLPRALQRIDPARPPSPEDRDSGASN